MNRHDRRRLARKRKDLEAFHTEAGGGLRTIILRAETALLVFIGGGGDVVSRAFRPALKAFHADLTAHDCLLCRATFSANQPPVDWLLMLPVFDTPNATLLSAICETCSDRYPSDLDLFHAAGAVFKAGLWPDLRIIDPGAFTAEGGRA